MLSSLAHHDLPLRKFEPGIHPSCPSPTSLPCWLVAQRPLCSSCVQVPGAEPVERAQTGPGGQTVNAKFEEHMTLAQRATADCIGHMAAFWKLVRRLKRDTDGSPDLPTQVVYLRLSAASCSDMPEPCRLPALRVRLAPVVLSGLALPSGCPFPFHRLRSSSPSGLTAGWRRRSNCC